MNDSCMSMSDMVFKLLVALCFIWTVSFSEKASSLAAKNVSLISNKHLFLIDAVTPVGLKASEGYNLLLRRSKFDANVPDCSLGSWNSSANCTQSPQAYFEPKKELTLPHEDSISIGILSTDAENVSLHNSAVNRPSNAKNIQPKTVMSDLEARFHKRGKINLNDIDINMIETRSIEELQKKRIAKSAKRSSKNESVQSVLKKIFPQEFFTVPEKKNQKPSDLSFPSGSRSVSVKYNNHNSSNRRQKVRKPAAERFNKDSLYFRAANEGTLQITSSTSLGEISENGTDQQNGNDSTITNETQPSTENTQPGNNETRNDTVSTEKTENATTSLGPNLNYHYHFHYFGIPAPLSFSAKESTSQKETTGQETTGQETTRQETTRRETPL